MSKQASKPDTVRPDHGIGSRQRQPFETTYGFPNREDGIQSIHSGDGDPLAPKAQEEGKAVPSGPGATHSNGMKGQKSTS